MAVESAVNKAAAAFPSSSRLASQNTAAFPRFRSRWFAVAFAALGAIFGVLPIANWLPGGHGAPWYSAFISEWISGSAIAIGVGLILAIVSRRADGIWREGLGQSLSDRAYDRATGFGVIGSLAAFLVYALVASAVFSRLPIWSDELVQLVQAKTFASGRLWRPAWPTPEFYSALNVVDVNG